MISVFRKAVMVVILSLVLVSAPVTSARACEMETDLTLAEIVIQGVMTALRDALQTAIQDAITGFLDAAADILLDAVEDLENSVIDTFADFAPRLIELFPDMTRQLSVARLDQTMRIGSFMDAENQIRAQVLLQTHEQRSRLAHLPGDTVCSVATGTLGFPGKEATVHAIARAWGYELAKKTTSLVTAQADPDPGFGLVRTAVAAPGDRGTVPDVQKRWEDYLAKYCEPGENAGNIPCAASGAWTDKDVLVGDMILNRITIDEIADPEYQAALETMARHLFEPFYPDPIPTKVLDGPTGINETARRRSEKARRQTAYDMFIGAVARRTPNPEMEEWNRTIREMAGMNVGEISDKPSYNEMAQTFTQARYMSPEYLIVAGGEKPKFEEVVQKTGLLMQLRDEYELTETLAMMYAAQLGMTMDKTGISDAMASETTK